MKFRNILLSSIVLIGAISCNEKDFLNVPPQGSLNDAIMNSVEGVDYLVNAAYSCMAGPNTTFGAMSSPVNHWLSGELHSDGAYKGGGGPSDNAGFHQIETNVIEANHSSMNNWWQSLYQSVKRTNMALNVLKNCTVEQVPNVEVLKAEMRTLRAHFYFELCRHFNKIVWITEDDLEVDYWKIRNDVYSRDELLSKIAKEFEEAATVLPESPADKGRANKYVALSYAAKVYLYKAYRQNPENNSVTSIDATDLQKVVSLTQQVISSGKYNLLDDFQKLDMVPFENAEESIWGVQYSSNDGFTLSGFLSSTAGHINWSQLLNTPKGPYGGDDFFKASQDLVNAFQTGADGLPLFDTFQTQDYDVVVQEGSTFKPTNLESNVDPRLDFTVGRMYVPWKTYPDEPVNELWYRSYAEYGFHIIKKFLVSPESGYMCSGYPWGGSPLNYQVIRYANVLLWRAEALIELGQEAEARDLINQLRRRAKNSSYVEAWADKTTYPNAPDFGGYAAKYLINEYPATGWTKDYARKALRFETRLETALEGERFFDLVRWGIAAETINKYYEIEKTKRIYYEGCSFKAGKDEYFPIPINQYNLTKGSYVQNPGYPAFPPISK